MLHYTLTKWNNSKLINKNLLNYLDFAIDKTNQNFKNFKDKDDYFFDVIIVSEREIKNINNKFRHINKATDVISFALWDAKETIKTSLLGEIYLCPEYIDKICKQENKFFDYEFVLTFVHGVLHLLGFDHANKKQEKAMFDLQRKITNEVF